MTHDASPAEAGASVERMLAQRSVVTVPVPIDREMYSELRAEVGDETVSAFIAEIVKERYQRESIADYAADYAEENGPFSQDAVQWAEAQWRKAGWGGPQWRDDAGE